MSYESFRNRETWLVNVWGYVEGLAELYMENEDPENVTGATPQWCRDCFDMLVEDTYKTLPNGILKDFVDGCLQTIDWHELSGHVKDEIRNLYNPKPPFYNV